MPTTLRIYGNGFGTPPKCVKCGVDCVAMVTVEPTSKEILGQFVHAFYCRHCRLIHTPLGCTE